MGLQVNILNLNQQVNFADGSVSNFITLELPNGSQITVLATDEDAQRVMAEVQRTRKIFKEELNTPVHTFTEAPDNGVMVFGGDEPPAPSPPRPPPPRQFPRPPHVESDEAGNPTRVPSRVAPEQNDLDEDGVPSL